MSKQWFLYSISYFILTLSLLIPWTSSIDLDLRSQYVGDLEPQAYFPKKKKSSLISRSRSDSESEGYAVDISTGACRPCTDVTLLIQPFHSRQ